MLSWLIRIVLIPAGVIAGWFVAKDAPNFGVVQAMVALFLIVFVMAVFAFTRSDDERGTG